MTAVRFICYRVACIGSGLQYETQVLLRDQFTEEVNTYVLTETVVLPHEF